VLRGAFIYIISNRHRSLYCGIATDLARRFREHQTGAYENAFTKRYNFDSLVWYKWALTLKLAAEREKQLKGWARWKKIELIESVNPAWIDLSPRLEILRVFE
jgi:putative endonuclease